MTRQEEIEQAAGKAFPLPPLYNEEQRRSKQYAESWARARDQQWGFQMGAMWADEHPRKELVDIDEACEWLENNLAKETAVLYSGIVSIKFNNVIDKLCKAMEE